MYTAPTALDATIQVTITAVASADPSKTAVAKVTVNSIVVGGAVVISPTRAALTLTEPQQFAVTARPTP